MAPIKVLITGATGYIGGSILTTLLQSTNSSLATAEITALVRGADKAKTLKDAFPRVTVELFRDLDDGNRIISVASEHDVVIHTASGFHTASARYLIQGLGQRKKQTGKNVIYIHTSGTSNLADRPVTSPHPSSYTSPVYVDATSPVYETLLQLEAGLAYSQRTTDIVTVTEGKANGVKTYIIMSPTIYGPGSGAFNKLSIQIPTMIRAALDKGYAEYVGTGEYVWNMVHIADLVELYEIIAVRAISDAYDNTEGEKIPYGEKGIYFSEHGTFKWKDMATGISDAAVELGVWKDTEGKIKSSTLEEVAPKWSNGNVFAAEIGFSSNSITRAEWADKLGWKPTRGNEEFWKNFAVEMGIILGK